MTWILLQVLLFAALLFLPTEQNFEAASWLQYGGNVLQIAGIILLIKSAYDLRRSLAITPEPKENGQLQVNGVYAYIRHPMYAAVWLLFGSGVATSGSYVKIVLLLCLIVFFVIKSRHEERLLIKKFPGYAEYMSKTGAFFPRNG